MTPQKTKQPEPEPGFKEAEERIKKSLAEMKRQNHIEYAERFSTTSLAKDHKWIDKLMRLLGLRPKSFDR